MKTALKRAGLLLLAACLIFMMCACSSDDTKETEYTDAQELLSAIMDTGFFEGSLMGGLSDSITDGAPGALSLSDPQLASITYTVPISVAKSAISASGVMNAMMANYFTASAWQFDKETALAPLETDMKENMIANQWLCATPEEYAIIQTGQFLIEVYGTNDAVEGFVDACSQVLGVIDVVDEGPLS